MRNPFVLLFLIITIYVITLVVMATDGLAAGHAIIRNDNGGEVGRYVRLAKKFEEKETKVIFGGICASACTVLLMPTFNLNSCMKRNAKFGFHQPFWKGKMTPELKAEVELATKLVWQGYPPVVKAYLTKNGWPSYHNGDSPNKMTWMTAKQLEGVLPYCD